MADALFYHLEGRAPETVLPQLLQRTLDRGWRAVVQAGSTERVAAIDSYLWTFDDAAFLPHGTREDGHEGDQPVFVTDGDGNPNGASIRFLLDRAALPADPAAYERLVILFDGSDAEALAEARQQWKALKALGLAATYWQMDSGRWVQKG